MAIPVQLEIFMKDLTKTGLQSVGKNVDDVESRTRQLILALNRVIAEQKRQTRREQGGGTQLHAGGGKHPGPHRAGAGAGSRAEGTEEGTG